MRLSFFMTAFAVISLLARPVRETGMNRRHRELLGKTPAADADIRGEHTYPSRKSRRNDARPDEGRPLERSRYAAGADGTQMVSEPTGAALPEEEEKP